MKGCDGHMDLQTVFVDSRQEVALHLLIIDLVKAEKIVKVDNLIVLRKDVIGGSDVTNVSETVLFSDHQDPNLDPLLLELVLGGH